MLIYLLANATLFWTIGNYSISLDGTAAPAKLVSIESLKRICSPPFISFAVAVAFILLEVKLPGFLMLTLKYMGGMTTPLSMLFIGIALYGVKFSQLRLSRDIVALLVGRFVIAPVFCQTKIQKKIMQKSDFYLRNSEKYHGSFLPHEGMFHAVAFPLKQK